MAVHCQVHSNEGRIRESLRQIGDHLLYHHRGQKVKDREVEDQEARGIDNVGLMNQTGRKKDIGRTHLTATVTVTMIERTGGVQTIDGIIIRV